MGLTVGSLFAGIGGFDVAATWMQWKTIWMIENNKFCRRVIRRQYPHVTLYGNIKKIDLTSLPYADVLVGGFPCQKHSLVNQHDRTAHQHEDFLWPFFADTNSPG